MKRVLVKRVLVKREFNSNNSGARHQRGAVLFVALVFLVLLTLLGLTASSTSVLQERMTGGMHNSQLALMGAETAQRGVEWTIWNKSNNTTSNKLHCGATGGDDFCYQVSNSSGVMAVSPVVNAFRNARGWLGTSDGGTAFSTLTLTGMTNSRASAALANQPRYLMEELGKVLPPGAPSSIEGGGRLNGGSRQGGSQTLYAYRITARSTGGNAGAISATESNYIALPPSF